MFEFTLYNFHDNTPISLDEYLPEPILNDNFKRPMALKLIAVQTDSNALAFISRIMKYEKIVGSLREELKDKIMQELGEFNIYTGSIIHENSNIRSGS